MPYILSTEVLNRIYTQVQSIFSDFSLFDKLVSNNLRRALADSNSIEIDWKTTKNVTARYYNQSTYSTPEKKAILDHIKLIFKTAYVLIICERSSIQNKYMTSIEELSNAYAAFEEFQELGDHEEDQFEWEFLLNFRNFLKAALEIIPARLNKALLIKIAAHLEGSQCEYITGGGQTSATTRRVTIYEQEGRIVPGKRKKSILQPADPAHNERNNSRGIASVMRKPRSLENVALSDADLQLMARPPIDPFKLVEDEPLVFTVGHKRKGNFEETAEGASTSVTMVNAKPYCTLGDLIGGMLHPDLANTIPAITNTLKTAAAFSSAMTMPAKIQRFQSSQSEHWSGTLDNYDNLAAELDDFTVSRFPSTYSDMNVDGANDTDKKSVSADASDNNGNKSNIVHLTTNAVADPSAMSLDMTLMDNLLLAPQRQVSWDLCSTDLGEDLSCLLHFMQSNNNDRSSGNTIKVATAGAR